MIKLRERGCEQELKIRCIRDCMQISVFLLRIMYAMKCIKWIFEPGKINKPTKNDGNCAEKKNRIANCGTVFTKMKRHNEQRKWSMNAFDALFSSLLVDGVVAVFFFFSCCCVCLVEENQYLKFYFNHVS